MDPSVFLVQGLSLGAAAIAKPAVELVVKDTYDKFKQLALRRHPNARESIEQLEASPNQDSLRRAAAVALASNGQAIDQELVRAATAMIMVVQDRDPDVARTVGIDIANLGASEIDIADVETHAESGSATGVRISDSTSDGKLTIRNVRTNSSQQPPKSRGQ